MKNELVGLRIFAYLIDSIIVQFFCVFITDSFELDEELGSFIYFDREFIISFSCYFIVLLVYLCMMDIFANGVTFGKKILKLKTISQDGQQLSTTAHLLRSLLKTISLSFLLPLIYYFIARQTFHDRAVKSKTVRA